MDSRRLDNFQMLLKALESSDSEGQKAILASIAKDDVQLSILLSSKLITVEKILVRDIQFISKIFEYIPFHIWPHVLHGRSPVYKGKVLSFLSFISRSKIEQTMKMGAPSPEERKTAEIQFVHIIRDLERKGIIVLDDQIDIVQAETLKSS